MCLESFKEISLPAASVRLPDAPLKRGISSYKAKHMASSRVDLPAPVLPVMAINPACASGSSSKLITCVPAKDAKFFKLRRKIFMANP